MIQKLFLKIGVLALLAGCISNNQEQTGLNAANEFINPSEFTPSARFSALFQEPRAVLDIEFIDLGVAGKLILEQQDGQYSRFLSSDLGGIVLQRGLVHSVFGFGEPLAASDLSEPLSLIMSGSAGSADRFHTYTDGQDLTVRTTFRCQLANRGPADVQLPTGKVATTLMSETCQSLEQSFENLYWIDRTRQEVIQSRQWVGPNVGSVVTQVTHP